LAFIAFIMLAAFMTFMANAAFIAKGQHEEGGVRNN
jgi:hypothetical protein